MLIQVETVQDGQRILKNCPNQLDPNSSLRLKKAPNVSNQYLHPLHL